MSTLKIDVRWRPEGAAVNMAYDKSFQGEETAARSETVAYIERNFLTFTTIKHPDRAESTRFRNFSLPAIEAALRQAAVGVVSQGGLCLQVHISYQSMTIVADNDQLLASVLAHPLAKSPRLDAGQLSLT